MNKILEIVKLTLITVIMISLAFLVHIRIGPLAVEATPYYISDSTYGSSWNGQTKKVPSMNAIYDFLHTIFTSDDNSTMTITGNIGAGSFTSSGSNPMLTVANASCSGDLDEAGDACVDTTENDESWWWQGLDSVNYAIGPVSQNITIDATDGTNTLTVTETVFIGADDLVNRDGGATAPAAATNVCSGDNYMPSNFRAYAGDDVEGTEGAQFGWYAPLDLDAASGIKFQLVLLQSSDTEAADTEVAQFEIYGCAASADGQYDCTVGGVTELSATPSGTDILDNASVECDMWFSDQTSALTSATITGLAAGKMVRVVLWRDHDDAGDTYEEDIGVIGVVIEYKLTKDNTL